MWDSINGQGMCQIRCSGDPQPAADKDIFILEGKLCNGSASNKVRIFSNIVLDMWYGRMYGVHAQSCPTVCVPVNCSIPASSVHGNFRQEYWRGLPFPPPGYLLNSGTTVFFFFLWQKDLWNSMKLWAMPCKATQDRRVIMKSPDKLWPTRGGNDKPLQWKITPMNRM